MKTWIRKKGNEFERRLLCILNIAIKVCVYSFICYTATCGPKGHGSGLLLPSRTAAGFSRVHDHTPVNCKESTRGAPISFSPLNRPARTKERVEVDKEKRKPVHLPVRIAEHKSKVAPRHPFHPPKPPLSPHPGLSRPPGDTQLPTSVSSKNSSTVSVAPSLQSFLTDGALGCFHPQSLPIRLHSLRI